ncbi:MAG: OmpA family protein [Acidobacteriota bacterium]
MRIRVGAAIVTLAVGLVLAGGAWSAATADAKRYRTCVYIDRTRPAERVIVDDMRVNEAIFDEGGVQYLWVHGPAGSFQLGFDVIRQIEVVTWLGKDPARDDYTRYSVKVTGTADGVAHYGTVDIRVMRGLAGPSPWYYFPVTQRDRGSKFWRITFGQECVGPTIPLDATQTGEQPAAAPIQPMVVMAKPRGELPPPPPPPEDPPDPDELRDVLFAYDKWELTQASRETLTKNAEWMRRFPAARIQVEGQADPRGTNEYNFPLGLRRAEAARDFLVSQGIDAKRLAAVTMGKTKLVCTEQTEECWQRNRRAHFVMLAR